MAKAVWACVACLLKRGMALTRNSLIMVRLVYILCLVIQRKSVQIPLSPLRNYRALPFRNPAQRQPTAHDHTQRWAVWGMGSKLVKLMVSPSLFLWLVEIKAYSMWSGSKGFQASTSPKSLCGLSVYPPNLVWRFLDFLWWDGSTWLFSPHISSLVSKSSEGLLIFKE